MKLANTLRKMMSKNKTQDEKQNKNDYELQVRDLTEIENDLA